MVAMISTIELALNAELEACQNILQNGLLTENSNAIALECRSYDKHSNTM